MMILYHNPRCSKSRMAVEMCNRSSHQVVIHNYISNPLPYDIITSLLERFEGNYADVVRWNDADFKFHHNSLSRSSSLSQVSQFLYENGHLMQRPFLDAGSITRLGRPVEVLQDLLD